MKIVFHVSISAVEGEDLFRDPRDHARFIGIFLRALPRGRILAYCLMPTHGHLVLRSSRLRVGRVVAVALRSYSKWFRRRHGKAGPIYRGPGHLTPVLTPQQLQRAIRYVHDNPIGPKLATVPHHHEWSSAPEFAGLSRSGFTNVPLALELLEGRTYGIVPRAPIELAGLERSAVATADASVVLAAAARTVGVYVEGLVSRRRHPRFLWARVAFVHLGRLEGFSDAQLALALGRSREGIRQLGLRAADLDSVRVARTLLRIPEVREQLRRAARQDIREGVAIT